MTQPYTTGKYAIGFCDRCGWKYPLVELAMEMVKQRPTNKLVCTTCFEIDHPQLMLGTFPIVDPQALRNPRTDVNRGESNSVFIVLGSSAAPVIGATIGAPVAAVSGVVSLTIV